MTVKQGLLTTRSIRHIQQVCLFYANKLSKSNTFIFKFTQVILLMNYYFKNTDDESVSLIYIKV